MADNLSFFPYQAADEPMFVVHNIDIIVSVAGSNILQAFKEVILLPNYYYISSALNCGGIYIA